MEKTLKEKTVKGGIKLEPSWFQVFDFLFNRYGITAPASQDKFSLFLSELSEKEPDIFVALAEHLNEINSGINLKEESEMEATLYDLENEFAAVLEQLEGNEGNPTGEVILALEEIEKHLDIKLEGYCKVVKNKEAQIAVLNKEIERLQKKKETTENTIEFLKERLKNALTLMKKRSLKTALFSVALKPYEKVIISSPDLLPEEFLVIKESQQPDKKLIKEAIKNGCEVTGAELEVIDHVMIR